MDLALIKKAEEFLEGAVWCGGHGMPGFPASDSMKLIRELIAALKAKN